MRVLQTLTISIDLLIYFGLSVALKILMICPPLARFGQSGNWNREPFRAGSGKPSRASSLGYFLHGRGPRSA